MNTVQKIKLLSEASKWDVCASTSTKRKSKGVNRVGSTSISGRCPAVLPSGRVVCLFKTLFTNECVHDCKYCVNSCGGRKTSFEPGELASIFMQYYLRNYVEGLFLSSGVSGDPDRVTGEMIETVKLLRSEHGFQGYVHLKVLPGVSKFRIEEMAGLADRLSINLESPNKSRFTELSSTKEYKTDIIRRLRWVSQQDLPAGHTTQFVIGAAGGRDEEVIRAIIGLYDAYNLRRAYFSAFQPVKGTGLEGKERVPSIREHRLYQVDWLYRVYGFSKQEIRKSLGEDGNLCLRKDPKEVIAEGMSSVDLGSATYAELLRVPGVGPKTARKIVNSRDEEGNPEGLVRSKSRPYLMVKGSKQKRLGDWK